MPRQGVWTSAGGSARSARRRICACPPAAHASTPLPRLGEKHQRRLSEHRPGARSDSMSQPAPKPAAMPASPPPPGPRGRERPARTVGAAAGGTCPATTSQALTPGIETRRAHVLAAAELGHTQPAARSAREQCLPLRPAAPGRAEVGVDEGVPSSVANKGSHSPGRTPAGRTPGSYRLQMQPGAA